MGLQIIPIPTEVVSHYGTSHSHSQLCVLFPFPWDSHGIPGPIGNPIPMHISSRHPTTQSASHVAVAKTALCNASRGQKNQLLCIIYILFILKISMLNYHVSPKMSAMFSSLFKSA